FVKVRHYGLLGSHGREEKLAVCRWQLLLSGLATAAAAEQAALWPGPGCPGGGALSWRKGEAGPGGGARGGGARGRGGGQRRRRGGSAGRAGGGVSSPEGGGCAPGGRGTACWGDERPRRGRFCACEGWQARLAWRGGMGWRRSKAHSRSVVVRFSSTGFYPE